MSWERDRERGFEEEYAHKEERAFKAAAHRNRLLAEWAAQKLGLGAVETTKYVESLVTGDVEHLRHRGIVTRIIEDFRAAGVAVTEAAVNAEFDRLDREAAEEYKAL